MRAVDRFTKQVIASTDFSVVLGPDVRVMLKTKDTSIISSAGDLPVSSVEEAVPADKDSVSAVESISNMGSVPGNTAPIPESPSSKSNPMPTVDPAVDGDPFSHQEKPVDSIN